MYIKSTTQVGTRKLKGIHHFRCDNCGHAFFRDISEISHTRLNNNVKHFCKKCGPSAAGKYGRSRRKQSYTIGNKLTTKDGYIEVCVGDNTQYSRVRNGYIREHVKVMQDCLKRQLVKGEVVHHLDGDKANNHIGNLDLCTIKEHNNAHAKSEQIIFELYKQGKVNYDRVTKEYFLVDK